MTAYSRSMPLKQINHSLGSDIQTCSSLGVKNLLAAFGFRDLASLYC